MSTDNKKNIHGVRDHFIHEDFLKVRSKTLRSIDTIAEKLEVGMNEQDGRDLIDRELKTLGVEKKWHPTKFRIGENTLCSFSEKSLVDNTLSDGEIFFLDIGPVWNGYEGDMGRTYIFGNNDQSNPYASLKETAQKIFEVTRDIWLAEKLTGIELYDFAAKVARDFGVELNTAMKGHRLGDFPHHLFYRGGMNETEEVPCNDLWVLEILIQDSKLKRGAFFEDILSLGDIL